MCMKSSIVNTILLVDTTDMVDVWYLENMVFSVLYICFFTSLSS